MKTFRVVEILTGTEIILNCGSEQGIKEGSQFFIYGLTKVLIDPETQEELGQAEIIRGYGKVVHLQPKLCTIRSSQKEDTRSKKIVRKSEQKETSIAAWSTNIFGTEPKIITTEEVETGGLITKRFDNVQIGDYARLVE